MDNLKQLQALVGVGVGLLFLYGFWYTLAVVAVGFLLVFGYFGPSRVAGCLVPQSSTHRHETSGVVLISGCSTGTGKDLVLFLASRGFHVVAGVRKQVDADKLVEDAGGDAEFVHTTFLDVTKQEDCVAAVEFTEKVMSETQTHFLGIVLNAGVSPELCPAEFCEIDVVKHTMNTNFVGSVQLTQAALPLLRKARGRIVAMSSIVGSYHFAAASPYTATKHAIDAYFGCLRIELYHTNVSVSILKPGAIKTKIWSGMHKGGTVDPSIYEQVPEYFNVLSILSEYKLGPLVEYFAEEARQSTTIDAFHALTSQYPAASYYTSGLGRFPCRLLVFMFWVLPDRLWDLFVNRIAMPVFYICHLDFYTNKSLVSS